METATEADCSGSAEHRQYNVFGGLCQVAARLSFPGEVTIIYLFGKLSGKGDEKMKATILIDACLDAGIDFFSGVPDSQLKGLCDELYDRFGTDTDRHVVAHNEGGAMGLCAGHYLATGRPGLCYMQNSGLGNAVNPLASLTDEKVYGLPCLLVIGWRGEPGVHDEPQHVKQGEITLKQLEILDIPYFVLNPETEKADFLENFGGILAELKAGHCAAIVVRKGALKTDRTPDYQNGRLLKREEAAEIILDAMGENDVVVSTTGKLSREIFEIRERKGQGHHRDFLTVGSMGHASMIALGIAAEQTARRVWCLDGDGAVLMHLGALAVVGRRKPTNLIHVVIDNGAHETVGGMPVCNRELNLTGMAESAGYPKVMTADSAETLRECLNEAVKEQVLTMITVRCACGARADLGRPTTTPAENRDALMNWLTAEGRKTK